MINRYFIASDILVDYLFDDNDQKIRNDNLTYKYIANILKNKENICVINSSSLIEILYHSNNKKENASFDIANLLVQFYNDAERWIVIEEDENIIKKALEYSEKTKIDYPIILQYFCAIENKCKAIITNNPEFPKIDISIISSK
ncbi:type II toxin-antitoxin system VapC family toxin [Aliarcobacter vitoriensis]|uniref:type II toxin-antitoxin system VapC family toxin n=1 Tax=Aliarcobacter vitoriensis TaxID=2011099 RepID=UPI003AABDC95